MSAKHTPGPWQVFGREEGGGNFSIWSRAAKAGAVAVVHKLRRESKFWRERTAEESEANANLIAAAPELLEAAKEIVSLVYREGRGGVVEFRPHEFDDLKAAIARAEGGQS